MASFRKRGRLWYFTYTDASGQRVERRGAEDRATAQRMASEAERTAARVRGGLEPASDGRGLEVAGLVAKYLEGLLAGGRAPKHVETVGCRLRKALAPWRLLGDVRAGEVQDWLLARRSEGMSAQTAAHYRTTLRAWGRWLVRRELVPSSPLEGLEALGGIEADRRRVRRALSRDEVRRLIESTRASTAYPLRKMDGVDRSWLYALAAVTGLRRGELGSLTPESFDLDGPGPPVVRVRARDEKKRRGASQPLPGGILGGLRYWLASKPPGRPLFAFPRSTAHMLAMDLKAAGLAVADSEGRVADLHALRATYVTGLVMGGASVKATQELARHSDPRLTLAVYAKLRPEERSAAVQDLAAYLPCAGPSGGSAGGDGSGDSDMSDRGGVRRKPLRPAGLYWRERMGIEPTRSRSHDPSPVLKTADPTAESIAGRGDAEEGAAGCRVFAASGPDLQEVAESWADLPEAIRQAILAMVRASVWGLRKGG